MTDNETQSFIDAYKRPDGIMDWYRVLDIPCSAPQEQIEFAFQILSATFHPKTGTGDKEGVVRYVLVQKAFEELNDPARRKRYDAFCRFQYDQARLLTAIETEKQRLQIVKMPKGIGRLLCRANTRAKRLALLAFPFFAAVVLFRLKRDLDHDSWEPSLSFLVFSMASALCLLLAFTRLYDWIDKPHKHK